MYMGLVGGPGMLSCENAISGRLQLCSRHTQVYLPKHDSRGENYSNNGAQCLIGSCCWEEIVVHGTAPVNEIGNAMT